MGNVLCITSGLTGILNASFELANRLERAGHRCTLACPLEVREKVEVQGFQFLQLNRINFDPAPEVPGYTGGIGKLKRLAHKIVHYKTRKNEAIDSLGMKQFLDQINSLDIDLFIVDVELHEHIMTLFTAKHKVVLLSQWFSTWNRKGLPPIQEATIPGIAFKGSKLGLQLAWMKLDLTRSKTFFKKKLNSVWTDRRSILQAYAKKIGFSKKFIPQNYWPGPFSYDLLPVLSMTPKELDFPHEVRPNMEYVGSMVHENRKQQTDKDSVEYEYLKKEGKSLIYCSVSTFKGGDTRFLKKLVKALEHQPHLQLVISLGGLIQKEQLGSLPANVLVFERVNQLQVLAHADLSINHGGIHTINECLHFRVPMLVYSGKRSDQNGCAARVHYHGVGLMADKDKDSSEEILAKIEQILSNSTIQQVLERFHQVNLNYKTNRNLEQMVEALLRAESSGVMQLKKVN